MKKSVLLSLLVVAMGVMVFVGCEKPEPIVPSDSDRQSTTDTIDTVCTYTASVTRININPDFGSCAGRIPDEDFLIVDYDYNMEGNDYDAYWVLLINDEERYENLLGYCEYMYPHEIELPVIDFNRSSVFLMLATAHCPLNDEICFTIEKSEIQKNIIDVVVQQGVCHDARGWMGIFYTDRKCSENDEYEININRIW